MKNITSLFRKSIRRGDGETLAFLAAALKRVIANDYREMLLGQAKEIERRLSEVDRVLTACDRSPTMNGLVEKIDAVHLSVGELLSILANPVHSIDPEKRLRGPAKTLRLNSKSSLALAKLRSE